MQVKNKNTSLESQVRKVITYRIIICLFLLVVAFSILFVYYVFENFSLLKTNITAECKELIPFLTSQSLIDNDLAIEIKINEINESNHAAKFVWIKTNSSNIKQEMKLESPWKWSYYFPITLPDASTLGYLKAVGYFWFDKRLASQFFIQIGLSFMFLISMLFLLLPLTNKIPNILILQPINNLLGVIKNKGTAKNIPHDYPDEIKKIGEKLRSLFVEIEQKTRESALSTIASQVAHDIRSPTAAIMVLTRDCTELPEKKRIILREAAKSIQDIANNLLSQHRMKDSGLKSVDKSVNMLVSATIESIISEKRIQAEYRKVQIATEINQHGHFAFISLDTVAFKSIISNLIDNAAESMEYFGKITLILIASDKLVRIIVRDEGRGMPIDLIQKIKNSEQVTVGKTNGHGLGLSYARETIITNSGSFDISSIHGKGTDIIMEFPRYKTPEWLACSIQLKHHDQIVILDDDASIHEAWERRFEHLFLTEETSLRIKHFTDGLETISFINDFGDRDSLFLLVDYELLKQDINGLDVIERSGVIRSILVTSHYTDSNILARAKNVNVKILPKQLTPEIPILVSDKSSTITANDADIIMVDDDQIFTSAVMSCLGRSKKIDHYKDPIEFLQHLNFYSKNVKICLDYNFRREDIDGFTLAKQIYEQGYINIFILSGKDFDAEKPPKYVRVIKKTDIESIKAM